MGSEKGNWSTKCLVRPLSQSPPLHEDAFLVQRKKISAKCEKIYLLLLQGMLYVARDESFMVIPKKILLGIDYLSDDNIY